MKKTSLLILLFLLMSQWAMGQKCAVLFKTFNKSNYQGIDSVEVSLMRQDTIPVAFQLIRQSPYTFAVEFKMVPDTYLLKVKKDGYEETTEHFQMNSKRNTMVDLGYLVMNEEREQKLSAAVVSATRIKMVMKGDTLVYDAAAFDLAEGSMLDALIEALPNTKLENGRITVNGKFIESLLVNGEDFFSGNPQVALQNLPAYAVKNVKVYDKASEDAYLKGNGKKPGNEAENMVMDVTLKKAYSTGWMTNVEGAYGLPKHKYSGKVFGLGYTDHWRLSAYTTLNNIKDTRMGKTSGNWGYGWFQEGELDMVMGGVDYLYKKDKLKLSGNAVATREDIDVQKQKSSVNFFEQGDVYGRSSNRHEKVRRHFITNHSLNFSGKQFYTYFGALFDYLRDHSHDFSRSADFTENPVEQYRGEALDSLFSAHGMRTSYMDHLLSRTGNRVDGKYDCFFTNLYGMTTISFPKLGDYMNINATFYAKHEENTPFTTYFRQFGSQSTSGNTGEKIQQDLNNDKKQYRYSASATYTWQYKPYQSKRVSQWTVEPSFSVNGNKDNEDNLLYELREELQQNPTSTGLLPSIFNSKQMAVNLNNTYQSEWTKQNYSPAIKIFYSYKPHQHSTKEYTVECQLIDNMSKERLAYNKHVLDTVVSRFSNTLSPQLRLRYKNNSDKSKLDYTLYYSFSESVPSLHYQLGTTTDSDPLNVYLNNPDLQKSLSHHVRLNLHQFNNKNHHSVTLGANYDRTDRALANARYYDRNTGVSTWRPENINGNWSTSGYFAYAMPLDKKEAFHIQNNTNAVFNHSVDYASDTETLTRSTVNNSNLSESLSLSYRFGKNSVGCQTGVSWQHSRSERITFEDIDAFLITGNINGTFNFKYNWQISTNLNLYCRRGYTDATLNTTDWVWNASVAKSFLKGNLTFKLNAVDLLNQISNVQHTVNAQGRTETWTNSIPRYAMLHVIYKLNIKPSKRK